MRIEYQLFRNKEDVTQSRPFTLLEIQVNNEKFGEIFKTSLNLYTIDLEKIHHFQKDAQIIKEWEISVIHPLVWSFSTTIIILLVLAIIFCVVWITCRRRQVKLEKNSLEKESSTENKSIPLFSF